MNLTTDLRLNRQSFTPLPLTQDFINSVYHLACRNSKVIDIRYRDRHPFLEPGGRTNDDGDDSTYTMSDDDRSSNEYDSDDNQRNIDNLHPTPDQ